MGQSARRRRLCCSITLAQPARHRDKAGKLYLPAVQKMVSDQTRTDSPHKRGHYGEQVIGLAAILIAGQRLAPATAVYALGSSAGAVLVTAIGLRLMSDRITRFALATIMAFAAIRLLLP